jgi:hypothetical protein
MENINITLNSALPQTTNIIMGEFDSEHFYINMDEFSEEENKIVNDLIDILNKNILTVFYNTNFSHGFTEINIIKPFEDCIVNQVSVDFLTLTNNDKDKISELINLILKQKSNG